MRGAFPARACSGEDPGAVGKKPPEKGAELVRLKMDESIWMKMDEGIS